MPKHRTRTPARKNEAGSRLEYLFTQALTAHQQGDLASAKAMYTRLLKTRPTHAPALHLRGVLASQERDWQQARQWMERALRWEPDHATWHCNLGAVLLELGQTTQALAHFDRALALQPTLAQAHYNRGNALRSLKQWPAALASYDQALVDQPDLLLAHLHRGLTLMQLQQHAAALDSFAHAIALDATHAEAHFQHGNACKQLQRLDEAIASYDRALALQPSMAAAHLNRGIVLHERKQLDAAIASYDAAIALQPDYAKARWNKALALLLAGDYANGWPLYGWRWRVPDFVTQPLRSSRPIWDGSPGQRILLWAEQGIGEEVMFSSMIVECRLRCAQLLVSVDARLASLLTRSIPPDIATFVPANQPLPEARYDAHLPLGNLCQHLRNDVQRFPLLPGGYLRSDPACTNALRQGLQQRSQQRPLCGISWYCKNATSGVARSIALQQMAVALAAAGVALVDLQYGDTSAERSALQAETGIAVLHCAEVDNFYDLDGLAALIAACDRVVTIDNSTAHLAGAMGQDVRVLLPSLPDWRWQLSGARTPWYASMTLYRQAHAGDWQAVLAQVSADLAR